MKKIEAVFFGDAHERQVIARAASLLSDALESQGASLSHMMVHDFDSAVNAAPGTIRVMSLAPALRALDTPWPEVERDLLARYEALCAAGDPVLVPTLFRHVERSGQPDGARILLRIRRLDLLAAELSRLYGAFVVDVDRVFADTGAMRLKTDYRAEGDAATELAGYTLALGITDNALDAALPFEVQERVKARIVAQAPASRPVPEITPRELMVMGKGRRRQVVSTITDAVQDNHVGWLLRQVVKGQIPPGQAIEKLVHAVRRRGVQESFSIVTAGLFKMIRATPQ
ncbi:MULTISPECIES: SGNH/GDSL hydrolase family protein [Nguyenibacter]|uniref:SGNH/GDSL hydrolase family protein n=1 Tax=Nguyenibacter vanlangensis TaxID=1216886 RepID=A0A7Y7IVJ7_9PROT|nr:MULTISPECIES: SGNH/GDSL hydrolase family protein [Nguyenibacter]NVN11119.1 SGNH/GDSL hydrolase family protein [Nguyenibacter vanlangensis]WRH88708.1 SGNH/GDSL hydrolase family protein [Nguyenibacter sp. L1]